MADAHRPVVTIRFRIVHYAEPFEVVARCGVEVAVPFPTDRAIGVRRVQATTQSERHVTCEQCKRS